jgi:uncharacterized repeat protein (TIGR01451 family)
LIFLAPTALGQMPPPAPGPAPLLYVRFNGPVGQQVTLFRGLTAVPFDGPVTVGLRPGYIYRVKLGGWTRYPGLTIYPTLEVRGSLCMPPKLGVANHPAPVTITEQDLERVIAGSLITKVVYLEDPEKAFPAATEPDRPIELNLPSETDLLQEARDHGRLMLIIRFGQREVGPDELAQQSIPGTMLFPGERVLAPPQAPPCLPWANLQMVDPTLGPKPLTEECLHDGGDIGVRAAFGPDGRLYGVDPSDTVAEFSDSHGRRHIAISCRICLCVPRFVVLRTECPIAAQGGVLTPEGARKVQGQELLKMRLPSQQGLVVKQLAAVQGRHRPNEVQTKQWPVPLLGVCVLEAVQIDVGPIALLGTKKVSTLTQTQQLQLVKQMDRAREFTQAKGLQELTQVEGPVIIGRVKGLDVLSTVIETRDLTVCCNEEPCPPEKPLILFKCADTHSAKIGDVVTFFLKYSNHGGQPISDVAVVDNLTSRLEYVPGSTKSDRPAVFTMQENDAGSVILRWEITGRLPPGESGVITFQAKIR